jgi:type VII secretion protein EccB
MGRLTGIPDGPDIIPTDEKQRAGGMWAICDDIDRQANLNNPTAKGEMTTTALTGVDKLGTPLPTGQELLVQAPDKQEYLIYRTPERINIDPHTSLADADAVRAKVGSSNAALAQAFRMGTIEPRPISTGLLNAIPQVGDLKIPDIPQANTPDRFELDIPVGHAFQVTNSDGSHTDYLMLPDGIENVSPSVAQLVLAKHKTSTGGGLPNRQLAEVAGVPKQDTYKSTFSQFPDQIPQILTSVTAPTVCLGWSADTSDPKIPQEHTEITIGKGLPLPSEKDHPVPISTPNAGGEKIDSFWMPPGTAAVIRSASSAARFDTGPISVVTGRGVRYGVPNLQTAKIVGLAHPRPAPASIVHLLPSGTQLDMAHAQKTYDSLNLPPQVGSYSGAAQRAAQKNKSGTGAQSGGK